MENQPTNQPVNEITVSDSLIIVKGLASAAVVGYVFILMLMGTTTFVGNDYYYIQETPQHGGWDRDTLESPLFVKVESTIQTYIPSDVFFPNPLLVIPLMIISFVLFKKWQEVKNTPISKIN